MAPDQRVHNSLSHFVTLILVTALILSLIHFARTAIDNYRLRHRAQVLQALIEAEEAEYERLMARKAYVASPEYQAKLAHELGLYAPNERRLLVVAPPELLAEQEDSSPILRPAELPQKPYWQQWWDLFFGDDAPTASP